MPIRSTGSASQMNSFSMVTASLTIAVTRSSLSWCTRLLQGRRGGGRHGRKGLAALGVLFKEQGMGWGQASSGGDEARRAGGGRCAGRRPHLYSRQAKSVCRPSSRLMSSLEKVRPAGCERGCAWVWHGCGGHASSAEKGPSRRCHSAWPTGRGASHPPCMRPRFLSQKMEQKEPEKKMPSTHANASSRSANRSELQPGKGSAAGWAARVGRAAGSAEVSPRRRQTPAGAELAAEEEAGGAGEGAKASPARWGAAGTTATHLSIHFMAHSAFFFTTGTVCTAWNRRSCGRGGREGGTRERRCDRAAAAWCRGRERQAATDSGQRHTHSNATLQYHACRTFSRLSLMYDSSSREYISLRAWGGGRGTGGRRSEWLAKGCWPAVAPFTSSPCSSLPRWGGDAAAAGRGATVHPPSHTCGCSQWRSGSRRKRGPAGGGGAGGVVGSQRKAGDAHGKRACWPALAGRRLAVAQRAGWAWRRVRTGACRRARGGLSGTAGGERTLQTSWCWVLAGGPHLWQLHLLHEASTQVLVYNAVRGSKEGQHLQGD